MRILIMGASGSGTTTLAMHVASTMDWKHLDADDYYWLATTPPYQTKRDPAERLRKILEELDDHKDVIVSGSLMRWGRELEDSFDIIVFLYLDVAIRVQRLRSREENEIGFAEPEFLQWAAQYDEGSPEGGRSLARHLQWLSERKCRVVKIEGDLSVVARCDVLKKTMLHHASENP